MHGAPPPLVRQHFFYLRGWTPMSPYYQNPSDAEDGDGACMAGPVLVAMISGIAIGWLARRFNA